MTVLSKFYGGVMQEPMYRYCYYTLDNNKIIEAIGYDELLTGTGSAINNYNCLSDFMDSLQPIPTDIIEIGTFMGLGSALLASYSRTVFTFDVCYRNSHPLWVLLCVDDRINCYTGDQGFIDTVITAIKNNVKLTFDFAFIDGMHKVENVRHDFENVKFCGRVLFHDVNIPEIADFVIGELGGKIINADTDEPAKFGYWEAK